MTGFSYQLYSSREFPPLGETLKMLAAAGYKGVEGYGALYGQLDAAGLKQFRADLDANGLAMPTAHFGLDMLERESDHAVSVARTLGIETIYCPFLMPDDRPSDADGWTAFGKRLQEAGEAMRKAGLSFGWHNHAFEFEKLPDGSVPMEHICKGGPDLEWEADIAWVARGGADPFEWIDRLGSKITAVHVKDIAPDGENADEDGWADVGHGTLPWQKLMERLRKTGAKHFIMEHDKPSDDKRFARRSIESASSY
jgi:sugar phosphate isomerase/epimerase